ncbi:hypothetical protein C7S20_08370 [Christiangramia fulva]|uniref:O-antigen ligase domain-containing protein n=1 Tax=Christiangramia fulva TaxID=2126553 RepID=A0A2R3Z4W7_9FLAO|nr:hypothetical protein [Christiangramia fulva]AVR45278.1 hypothetical protein C7S20_08370 [Christiangramia fulva]
MQGTQAAYLKRSIWVYLFLLIFEGALRKWVFPGLSQPLLIVRDPLAAWLIFESLRLKVWSPNVFVILGIGLTLISFCLTLLFGHGNLPVALYGSRMMLLHFPLIFIIGRVLNKEDVLQFGKAMLWCCIGMTLLVAVQFYSPQSAWINRGVAGELGSGFSGAMGYYRVPGTFSFTNGLSAFYGLCIPFIAFFWVSRDSGISKILLYFATVAYLAAIPLSISRTVVFQTVLTGIFIVVISAGQPKVIIRLFATLGLGFFLFIFLTNFSFFETSTKALSLRFEQAGHSEGGLEGTLVDRFLGGLVGAVSNVEASWIGKGLGMGTNVGSTLMTGKRTFLVSEGEWGRLIGERGFILGLFLIAIRLGLGIKMYLKSWRIANAGNILPWLLLSFALIPVVMGQWAQTTSLGFAVFSGGLVFAAMRSEKCE